MLIGVFGERCMKDLPEGASPRLGKHSGPWAVASSESRMSRAGAGVRVKYAQTGLLRAPVRPNWNESAR